MNHLFDKDVVKVVLIWSKYKVKHPHHIVRWP